jgi:hypothetical protein
MSHRCDRNERWPEHDARGIFLCYVCPECETEKLAKYRPEIFSNPNYEADEPIEPEEDTPWERAIQRALTCRDEEKL